MIARETKIILGPKTQRHSGIGVVSTNDVQHDEGCEQEIRHIRQLKATMSEEEHDDKNDQEQVFKYPCLLIERVNRGNKPGYRTSRRQSGNKSRLEVHAKVF